MTSEHPPARTLVVTVDADGLSDVRWAGLKHWVNDNVDKVIGRYCRDGAHVVRRSEDVTMILEETGDA